METENNLICQKGNVNIEDRINMRKISWDNAG